MRLLTGTYDCIEMWHDDSLDVVLRLQRTTLGGIDQCIGLLVHIRCDWNHEIAPIRIASPQKENTLEFAGGYLY